MKKDIDNPVYLKPNLVTEALYDNWYAWSHLISPVTAALNIKERHLKILKSFIQNPQIHEAAVKKPEMKGGPFIDYPRTRVDEIRNLYEKTIQSQKGMLELADAISELTRMLDKEATGHSLQPLYEKIPNILKGYVELVYDLNNNANFKIFEALLYKSKYYKESSQSICLQLVNSDEQRSFVLSTPRLEENNIIHCDIAYKDSAIDELFKMLRNPNSFSRISKLLEIKESQVELFRSFFTEEKPKLYEKYIGEGIRTRYFGHASILIETKEISILVDPVLSYDGYDSDIPRFTSHDLPDSIDFVLITHNHQDHILFETLLQIRHKVKTIVVPRSNKGSLQDPDLKLMFQNIGFKNVIGLGDMESLELPKCSITGIPFLGEHADLDIGSKLCYYVELHNKFRVFLVADSCNIEPEIYVKVREVMDDVDIMFIGMECDGAPLSWLYGPLLPEKLTRDRDITRRLAGSNCEQGLSLIDCFNPKAVFVYAMGLEPWLEFISSIKYTDESRPIVESNKLIEICTTKGIISERLFGEKTMEYLNESLEIR
ncbi:MBL fold metallo-hydrolase [Gillisia sp. Hel_I_29]|uniref:MBL fold metallo-hydrolase n=1 Tax=Gillisia sp. Hel_I_29 TaxID=1249975 RepID=UPI0005505B15|nr:MBL fold metallo-hydrolase [Gillisia sp. Hel_I_29]